ncbi:MAG: hypothetical protein GTO02_03655 [Candidatus Dadabacteria bacterium]|nr:hypothetical protein [Candidatus Dadabacteria bacterium]NIQ13523.1 hypothetical protein [Candidatus Dadabacteria bacterium]
MNKLFVLILPLLISSFLFVSCGSSEFGDGVVELDGPIMESIGREGNLEFNGAVINTADFPVKSVYVLILLRDSSGEVIETNNILISDGEDSEEILDSSESAIFSIPFKTKAGEAFSREVEIYYEPVN